MSSSIYNYFRNLFSHQPNSSSDGSSNLPDHHVNGFRDPIWDTYETDESDVESRLPHGSMFSIYSNPLEIHRFFESRFDEMEQKMNVIMRDFATFDNFNQFSSLFVLLTVQFHHIDSLNIERNSADIAKSESGIPTFPPALEGPPVSDFLPALEGPSAPALEPSNKNIRDKLLKPGFQSGSSAEDRVDSDLDGRIASEEIGSLLDKRSSDIAAAPLVPFPSSPGDFTSYSSHIRRTVRLPNGTIERVDIIRDGAGNENRTVTIKKPNGEETTVTTETPASGNTILPNGTSDGSRWWSW